MQRFCILAFTSICLFAFPHANAQEADERLVQLMDQVWDFDLTESPMLATDVGDPRGQDRLAGMSLEDIDRRQNRYQQFLKELEAISRDAISESRRSDYEILRRELSGRIDDYRFDTHLIPITNREGFHISFPELPRTMRLSRRRDFENYIARLNDFRRYATEHIELLRRGAERGQTLPAVVMREALDQVTPHIVDDQTRSLLYEPFEKERPKSIDAETWQRLREQAAEAIRQSVVPGYESFRDFLRDEYLPQTRDSISAAALPDGRAFYRSRVERFTTLDLEPQAIHQTGKDEVARIRDEMETVRRQAEFEGSLAEFIEFLRTDPQFYADTAEELLKSAALILKRTDGKLPEFFGRLPRTPYGLREVPEYVAPQTTSAYYWPPATDGTRAGFYYLNTYNLSSRPLYQLEALSMHEAVPGHHLQLALQAELEDLHPLRRQISFTAFVEGWALYSEYLGREMGFYEDPYQKFGQLSMEAWRACRLVVDTGIHQLGWTRQQAIDYMLENTALSRHNVVAEVDRYIAWPGQALGYKIGELTIRQLRAEAEAALGEDFDIRAFHDTVLEQGAIPLPILQQHVRDWVAAQHSQ